MINHVYKELYQKDSVPKQLIIDFGDNQITNSDLYSESFELVETLCSESELLFGACEASVVKFKVTYDLVNTTGLLTDKWCNISQYLNGDTSNPFKLGRYKVHSDSPSTDKNYRDIVAYDALYDIINADVTEWYESLVFPITQREFRDSFFNYLGISQENVSLIHDNLQIEKTITGTGISGKLIIVSICELNGVFGHINRNGNFAYVSLQTSSYTTIPVTQKISCNLERRTVPISKLQIRQEENDLGVISGSGSNCYIIENNFLVYGKTEEELQSIADAILDKIGSISGYMPFNGKFKGNPCFEVGDSVASSGKNSASLRSFILERRLSGIQGLRDEFSAKGTYQYGKKVNSLKKDIQQLKGKTNVLERTLESTRSEITDIEEGLNTKIEQTTDEIKANVQRVEKNMSESLDSVDKEIETLTKKVEVTATAEDVRIEIQKELDNGVTKVVTNTGYVFGDEGLDISRSDSEISTKVSHDGMSVKQNDEIMLAANSEGVKAKNLHATTYLIIGATSRFEDYEKDGEMRTGCFWMGA